MGPFDRRRSTAWAALLVVLAVLPFAALPAKAMGVAVGAVATEAAADDGMACGGACPMMEAARRSGERAPMACHRPAPREHSAPRGDDAPAPMTMDCCSSPAPPAVPFDEAAPAPLQVLDVPPPASVPTLPVPPAQVVAADETGPPLPLGPALYTLYSSLLN